MGVARPLLFTFLLLRSILPASFRIEKVLYKCPLAVPLLRLFSSEFSVLH